MAATQEWLGVLDTVQYHWRLLDDDYQAALAKNLSQDIAELRVIGERRLAWYLDRAHPNNRAAMLWEAWESGKLLPRVLAGFLGTTCFLGGLSTLSIDQWRTLADAAGYTQDGRQYRRPSRPIELWRGAVRGGAFWTSYIEFGQMYQERRPGARLWRTVAPPEALLCRNVWLNDGWDEFVVDTRGLTIHQAEPAEPLTLEPKTPRPDHIPANHF
ncbi:hypothetical protein [Streptomyces coffeae]|uniref:Uncharacterized protein n=1 Tax=Streptomyces coffeae TaxID=621382 RepID=A0ABS1NGJ0_9ACTN|nr:hypothetical protein [Streptomyces coffeae]MBL1098921.1 hypothetical protein [Streptomyces coffeae]